MTTRRIVVRPGDTLSSLALRHLGSAGRWPDLYRANAGAIAAARGISAAAAVDAAVAEAGEPPP